MTEKSYPRLENGVILYGPRPAPAKPAAEEAAEKATAKKATKGKAGDKSKG